MKGKLDLKSCIFIALAVLMIVAGILILVFCFSKKSLDEKIADEQIRDKVDCTILPSPRGKNPFVGKSFEIRTESTLSRFSFADDGMLYVTEPCTLDKRLTITLESSCEYTWNTDMQELYVKPVSYKINEDYSSYSNQIKRHCASLSLDALDKLPYPWYSQEDKRTADSLLQKYFSILIDKKLFELEKYNYDVQDHGLMLDKIEDDIFNNAVSFALDSEQAETTVKISRYQIAISCPDDESGNPVFYAGIPEFDEEKKVCVAKLCRLFYDDSIQIESGSRIKLGFLPQEMDEVNGVISIKVKVLDVPEETGIKDGDVLVASARSAGDLMWYNLSSSE